MSTKPATALPRMFQFLAMAGNYETRRVGRDDFKWGFVSTCSVNDGRKPYETAVEHKDYNNGSMVVVECYDSKEQAAKGHKAWIKKMTAKKLPIFLKDCFNAEIGQLCEALGDEGKHFRKGIKPLPE